MAHLPNPDPFQLNVRSHPRASHAGSRPPTRRTMLHCRWLTIPFSPPHPVLVLQVPDRQRDVRRVAAGGRAYRRLIRREGG